VCGSFTNWLTPIPMAPDGTGGGKVFAVVCNLPPGCVSHMSPVFAGHTAAVWCLSRGASSQWAVRVPPGLESPSLRVVPVRESQPNPGQCGLTESL